MQKRNHEVISEIMTQVSRIPRVAIQDYMIIKKNLASVTASVSSCSNDEIVKEIALQTETALRVIPDSIRRIPNKLQNTARFFVTPNRQVIAANSETLERLVQVNANVYADEETNSIWKLNGEGPEQFLVQQSSDNLEEILEARRNRQMKVNSSQYDGVVPHYSGDFAAYASESGAVRAGMLYYDKNELKAFNYENKTVEELDPRQVVCAAQIDDEEDEIDVEELRANISELQGDGILNYFRRLYGNNPAFFNRLTQLVKDYDGTVQLNDTNTDVNDMLQNVVNN